VPAAKHSILKLLRDPQWAHQEVNQSLKKGGFIALNSMAEEIHDPAADEQRSPEPPVHHHQEDDAGDDDGNPDRVEKLIPRVCVLVIVLRHVLIELRHAAPRWDFSRRGQSHGLTSAKIITI
jgi:hypothetical protein